MGPLKHDNLVRLLGAVWNEGPDKLCLVLEYVENGSLLDVLVPGSAGEWANPRFGLAHGIAKCLRFRFNSVYQGDELRYESPFDLALRLVAARSDCINFVDKNNGRRIIFSLDGRV